MTSIRWHELVGRRVVDADGTPVGRLVDLVATPVDDRLCVTALLVGPRAWIARVGQRRWLAPGAGPIEIPWGEVTELGAEIRVAGQPDRARGRGRHRTAGAAE